MVEPSDIREHMAVIGADGVPVGTVDHVEGDRIKLTRDSSSAGIAGETHGGHHHFISLGLVAGIEGDTVRLSANADVAVEIFEEEEAETDDSSQPAADQTGAPDRNRENLSVLGDGTSADQTTPKTADPASERAGG